MDAGSRLGCPRLDPLRFEHAACTWVAEAEHYRRLQEAAYTNQDGAGLLATVTLMLIYPGTVCFQQLLADAADKYLNPWFACFVAEFGSAVLPLTIVFSTPHTAWMAMANLLAVCAALASVRAEGLAWLPLVTRIRASRAVRKQGIYAPGFSHVDPAGTRLRFVSEYRAMVMITTCIVILAVDFPSVFPREHAKTEEHGYSLMDLGTGCVVCASAVSSRAARGLRSGRGGLSAALTRILSLWPVLALGFARLIAVRGIDYHVPTSEYGVHWNFFFTIAVVALAATVFDLGPQASVAAGTVVLVAYQIALSHGGLERYILHAPREGLFSANREGIFSCCGYLGIHWMSVGIGSLWAAPPAQKQDAHETLRRLMGLAVLGIGAAQVLDLAGSPASHRLCNLPYAVLCVGVNALVLGTLAAVDLYWPWTRRPMPHTYAGIQDSMLFTFLVANLLTGAVNVSVQPLLLPPWAALLALSAHSLCWSVPFGVLHSRGIALKFW